MKGNQAIIHTLWKLSPCFMATETDEGMDERDIGIQSSKIVNILKE